MNCPVCADATLLMSERQGVEIDYCPSCRGVWLDRGELDKLVELSAGQGAAPPSRPAASPAYRPDFEDSDYGRRHGHHALAHAIATALVDDDRLEPGVGAFGHHLRGQAGTAARIDLREQAAQRQ